MNSQTNNVHYLYPQVLPPTSSPQNWQLYNIVQEKDTTIKNLNIGELYNSIQQQEIYLDGFENKIEKLEEEIQLKTKLLNDKDNEIKNLNLKIHKLHEEKTKIIKSEENTKSENQKLKSELNKSKLDVKSKEGLIEKHESKVNKIENEV